MLTGKNQNTQRKPGPVPLCPPQIPYRLAHKWTRTSVVRGPGLTEPSIYGGRSYLRMLSTVYISVPMCCTTCSVCYKSRLCTVWEVM